jgi:FixJ family two-component response regulator
MSNPLPSVSIVDDDAEVRSALARLVASAGYDVRVHGSGSDFLHDLAQSRPACVVLDLQMPGTSGYEVLQALARGGIEVPVVTITGYDSASARTTALLLGARAYLGKPVDGEMLLVAIADAIGCHKNGGRPGARS